MRFLKLSLRSQLAVMGVIPLLLIIYLIIYLYREQDKKTSLLRGYIDRITLATNISRLINELQEERRNSFDRVSRYVTREDYDLRRKNVDSIIHQIQKMKDPLFLGFEAYTGLDRLKDMREKVDSNKVATNALMHYYSNMIFRLNTQHTVPYGVYTYLTPVSKDITSHKLLSDILTYAGLIRANFYNVLVTRQYVVETLAGTIGTFDVLKSYEKELEFKTSEKAKELLDSAKMHPSYIATRSYIDEVFQTFKFDSTFTADEWWNVSGDGLKQIQNIQHKQWETSFLTMTEIYKGVRRAQKRNFVSLLIILAFLVGLIAFIFYFISRDTRRLKDMVAKRTNELNASNMELQRSNRELEEFAFVASHDLQEPLRKIQTFSDIIQRNLDDPELTKTYLAKLSLASKRMSDLISSVLNYSKLRTGPEDFVKTDLNKILASVKEDLELMITEKKAIIFADDLPTIQGIPAQLYQLFFNLINNSLKFSSEKPIINIHSRINVRIPPDANLDQRFRYCEITLVDNGIGFDPEFKEQIFAIFQRLHPTHLYQGTGIGLALCKKIVENHGGHIRAESQAGKGAKFIMLLRQ